MERQEAARAQPADGGDTPEMVDVDGVESDGDGDGDDDTVNAAVSAQIKEIERIWRSHLKAAHSSIESTFREYRRWHDGIFGDGADSKMKGVYAATKKASRRRMEWEQQLSAQSLPHPQSPGMGGSERLELWRRYIESVEAESKSGGHRRRSQSQSVPVVAVQALWERAVSECFLYEVAWWYFMEWSWSPSFYNVP